MQSVYDFPQLLKMNLLTECSSLLTPKNIAFAISEK